jgi:sulfatase maturation enzyme AslB (radical SAM superfamily)
MELYSWSKFVFKVFKANFFPINLPFKYFLVVTKSCGSRCTNCLIWKEKVENELSLDEYEKLAKNSASNLHWLNISGGEPTDRSNLIEIIQTFVEHCPSLQIANFTTNALNLDRLKDVTNYLNSSRIPIIGINVSIDGPPKINDTIRGTPGGFEKSIEALKFLRTFKKIKSAAAMTLFPNNYKLIEETVLEIKNHIPDFTLNDLHLNFPHTSDHYYGNSRVNYKDRIDFNAISPILSQQKNSLLPFEVVEKIYQRKLREFINTQVTPVKCAAMSSNIYISERGEIFPCTIWNKKIGSLRESDFNLRSILNTSLAKQTLEEIKSKKCPNCWTPCEAFPSIITDLRSSIWSIV